MQISWPPLPRPRRRICLEWYWLKTCIRILQHPMVLLGSIKSNWVQAGWILYRYSWKKMYCLSKSLKLTKYEGKLLGSGSLRIENYTSALSLVLALCAPRSIRITYGGAARRGLWKPYRRKIPVSQGSYPRILVAKHAKRGAGVCQEMRSMLEVCAQYSPALRGSQPYF